VISMRVNELLVWMVKDENVSLRQRFATFSVILLSEN
jgi:hypothetical protein